MIKFTKEKILLLHQLIAQETGGEVGLRDQALLESAIESAFATFDGQDLYPTKEAKAARLGYALISNHAFLDGNKRIGVYVMLTFLGALVGMGLGNLMHRFVIVTVEVNEAMFGREIHPISYLYSFLFTVAFSMFVNWIMFYKLKKIDMVESLKSIE